MASQWKARHQEGSSLSDASSMLSSAVEALKTGETSSRNRETPYESIAMVSAINNSERKGASYHDAKKKILGCKHYQRGCLLKAECCDKWFGCRFCHDEVSDHSIDRHATKTMACMHCDFVQPVGQDCVNCSKRLGEYFCSTCNLWDNDTDKSVYHCEDCGICRIGKGLDIDYFHCEKCNVCLHVSLRNNHRCIESSLESGCPICHEYMFTSTGMVIFMPCGHPIHWSCYQEHIKNSYQCPICWKSLANMTSYFQQIDKMLEEHRMPPEYNDFWSICLCNDCEKKSKVKYHFLYHKCQECGSYNTKILQTVQERPDRIETSSQLLASEMNEEGRPRSASSHSSNMQPDENENTR
jgi:hypothetical protein